MRLHDLLHPDDLILCDKSEEGLRVMTEHFFEVCKRRNLMVSAGKSKVMGLEGPCG